MTNRVAGASADQLPTLYGTKQHIRLQTTGQHPAGRLTQEDSGLGVVQHEGRLLQRTNDHPPPPVPAHQTGKPSLQSDSFWQELKAATSSKQSHGVSADRSSPPAAAASSADARTRLSDIADLKEHNASSAPAGRGPPAQSDSHLLVPEHNSSAAVEHAVEAVPSKVAGSSGDDSHDPQHMDDSESIGYSDGADILGLIGLPADLEPTQNNPQPNLTDHAVREPISSNFTGHRHHLPDGTAHIHHTAGHRHNHSMTQTHHTRAHLHPGNPPESATCFVHKDLPIPGMDIAPADKDRCYAHPPEYKNKVCGYHSVRVEVLVALPASPLHAS